MQGEIGMSAKTKIVVLHMKELIYTAIFAVLGILFVVLLAMMFLPGKDKERDREPDMADASGSEPVMAEISSLYIPGVYTTQLLLGNESLDVEVIVDKDSITSIRLVEVSDSVATMYPLLQPTLDSICEQVYAQQSLESVTYTAESKYTSLVLLEAIQASLDKAAAQPDEEAAQ